MVFLPKSSNMLTHYQPKTLKNNIVYNDLFGYCSEIPVDHHLFTGSSTFSLPKSSANKHHTTWEHVIRNLSRHVIAGTARDCYIATFKNDKGDGPLHKFNGVNVPVHHTCAALAFPNRVHDIIASEQDEASANGLVVARLCSNTKCFNPRHLVVETKEINETRKGCRFSCRQLCPHVPRCVFVRERIFIPCLNRQQMPRFCRHPRLCHQSLKPKNLKQKRIMLKDVLLRCKNRK